MKKITYHTKPSADLWFELNRRMINKSKAMMSNLVLDLNDYPKKKLPEDHWFNYQVGVDFEVTEFRRRFMEISCETLNKVYKRLSAKDKKTIDKYNDEQAKISMAKLYKALSSEDYGDGVYMSDGMYLHPDGTLTDN